MLDDTIGLLDRVFTTIDRRDGIDFILDLHRGLSTLKRDPRIAVAMADEIAEVKALIQIYWDANQVACNEIRSIQQEVVTKATARVGAWRGNLKKSWLARESEFEALLGERDDFDSSAGLPGKMAGVVESLVTHARWCSEDESGNIQTDHDHQRDQCERLDPLIKQVWRLKGIRVDAWHSTSVRVRSHPGAALIALGRFGRELEQSFFETSATDAEYAAYHSLGGLDVDVLRQRVLEKGTSSPEGQKFDQAVARLKTWARRAHEGIRMRLGTQRSLLRLFERYRSRCQNHDRVRLVRISRSKEPERALTEEMAKWLFDQGLNPVTEMPVAGLRADIVDPGQLYVEAKQYSRQSPRSYVLDGFFQTFSTIQRLRNENVAIEEAFYVVFRLGGPTLELPEMVRFEGWTVFPRLIDLAPSKESGRHAARPIGITEDEIRSAASDSPKAAKVAGRKRRRRGRS